jgi:type IV secretory system conjugative DNA transfer VirD4/TraG family protein
VTTEQPAQPGPSLALRVLALGALGLVALEALTRAIAGGHLRAARFGPVAPALLGLLRTYWRGRHWTLEHRGLAVAGGGVLAVVGVLAWRQGLILWSRVKAQVSGTAFRAARLGFPMRRVDLLREVRRRPPGQTFVGCTPRRRLLGWRWTPVYLSPRQRTTHRHVVGKTGSGKTSSVLWPQVLQDVLDGKGVLVVSAKGSDEEVGTMKAMAALAGRQEQLRVFSLPAWSVPGRFSHTYNLVHVRPRTPGDSGGDVAAMAQRVFSVLPLGDNVFYRTQAEGMFTNLCRLLHGLVDEDGHGIPFVVRDVSVCLKALGNVGGWARALDHCLSASLDREAAALIRAQVKQLDRDLLKALSGLVGALDKFQSLLVNAYAPDVILEDVLETNGLVHVQLPANLFPLQAPALGKVLLMDVQQAGSLRQVYRTRNQRPFSVTVDEFGTFADLSLIDSLNKLRDAQLEYTLAHQSLADLELVSKEFATAVWDNTRTKDILNQDNPELCERIARSIGTHQVRELTVRRKEGPLLTSLPTGDASSRLVEAYRLHPNAIKALARAGQGYVLSDDGLRPVVYGALPPLSLDYPLARNNQAAARGLRLYETFVAG